MEAIKVSVEVSVNLSENTQNFIRQLFTTSTIQNEAKAPAVEQPKPAKQIATPKATKVEIPAIPEQPAETKSVAPATPAQPASGKSIEDVRELLAKKVNDNRDAIKQKLTELGSPSVTKLDPSKYDEMYNFLESL